MTHWLTFTTLVSTFPFCIYKHSTATSFSCAPTGNSYKHGCLSKPSVPKLRISLWLIGWGTFCTPELNEINYLYPIVT